MAYAALTVAKWFLYRNQIEIDDYSADYISNMKLQKLLYYAQGASLALLDKPIFNDDIVAWEHGPVVRSVYQVYKINGSNGIEYEYDYDGSIAKEDEDVLEQVYNIFGQYSASGLRNMTHRETPWKATRRNDVIDLNLIKEYFKEHHVENE